MELRDYQFEAGTETAKAYAAGIWSQLLVLPTGAGKTVVFSRLPSFLSSSIGQLNFVRNRMLIVAHREELLTQARAKLAAAHPGLAVEIEQGEYEATPMAEIVIASIATLAARGFRRLDRLGADTFKIIVIDEAHHATADTYQGLLARLGLIPPAALLPTGKDPDALHAARARVQEWRRAYHPDKLLLGVTATPSRADAAGLEWTFEQVTYEKSLRYMIERGYLVPPVGYAVDTGIDLDTVKVIGGDFQQKGLAAIVNTPERNAAIVRAWHEHAAGASTLVFGVDVQHAKDLAAMYAGHGITALALDGTSTPEDRAAGLERFRAGELRVLTNCGLFTEGTDLPMIGCVVMARPTKSATLFSQMIGRGLRLFAGKTRCVVIDGVDNSTRHSLVTLGDLFGLPSRFNLKGADAARTAAWLEQVRVEQPALDLDGVRSIADVKARIRAIDLFTPKQSPLVRDYAAMTWIADGTTAFHLPITGPRIADEAPPRLGRLTVSQGTLGDWRVYVEAPNGLVSSLAICDDIADAFARGEKWIALHHPHTATLHDKHAEWRQRPPTAKQITKLQEWGVETLPKTRGEASDLMTAFIQGKGQSWKSRHRARRAGAAIE
jgi:ATP-dependent helicase IRC3